MVVLRSGQFGGEEKRKFFLAFKVNLKLLEHDKQEYHLDMLMEDLNSALKSLNLPEYYKV